jgi:type II secretory pathway pseudopilin PulG
MIRFSPSRSLAGLALIAYGLRLRRNASGFTLAELLITVVLASVVIAGIGSVIVSQARTNAMAERNQRLRDDWSRVADFIESDIFRSERAYPATTSTIQSSIQTRTSAMGCGYSQSQIKLALVAADTQDYVVYYVKPISAGDLNYRGPYALYRCGRLDVSGGLSGSVIDTVIVDGLPAETSFSAMPGVNALASASRDLSLVLALQADSSVYSGRFGGQSRVNPSFNLLNDEASTGSSCGSPSTTALLCGTGTLEFTSANCAANTPCDLSAVHQFKPGGAATIVGNADHIDAVYFQGVRAGFELSSPCSRDSCTVTGPVAGSGSEAVQVTQGDVLVFFDKEVRI